MKKNLLFAGLMVVALISSCTKEEFLDPIEEEKITEENEVYSKSGTMTYVPDGYQLVWNDEFNGTNYEADKWSLGLHNDASPIKQFYYGEHVLGYTTPEDIVVENGTVKCLNQKRTYQGTQPWGTFEYTTGIINTKGKGAWNKCYVEVRAKFPSGNKVWPAIWMVANEGGWPPEWDLFEYFGEISVIKDMMGNTLHYTPWPNNKSSEGRIFNYSSKYDTNQFHIFSFEWTAEYAIWRIDGNITRILNAYDIGELWPNQDMNLILSNGVRTASSMGNTQWPNALEVDYVRVYQRPWAYNRIHQNAGFEYGYWEHWGKYSWASVSTFGERSGSHCVVCKGMYSGVERIIYDLEPNTRYRFEGYVRTHGGARAYLSAKDCGGPSGTTQISSGSYTLGGVDFVTGPTNTSVKICFYKYGDVGFAYGDDFRVFKK